MKSFRWYGPIESLPSSFLCLRGHEFLLVCMRLEFKRIIPIIVQNIRFVGEVFQIEVSDGLVHQLGSCQNINLHPARVYRGTSFFKEFVCV